MSERKSYRSQESEIELPNLPGPSDNTLLTIIGPDQLTRKKLKLILHLITGELRSHGVKTPHVFLPYRSKIDDVKLENLLTRLFPNGELIDTRDEAKVKAILTKYDDFTLICALKYLWSRLPNHEIVGWDVYHEYKRKEKEAGYPKNAFLTIMPKCLLSPAHASIVYDFLDLLISLTANSQYNYLSGRKIAKMAALWGFNSSAHKKSIFYDATYSKENNFIDGLESWKVASDALFHLLLSFLRAMLPESEMETLRLPKTLQSLLITNSYPPQPNNDSLKSMITIPCVVVKSTKPSTSPYELLSKVRHTLKFEKKNSFLSVENYTILKNIFHKESTNEIVSTLTEESTRVLSRITAEPINSDYDVYPGWAKNDVETDQFIPLFSQVDIHNVTLQDYYIWTWLSSIASDQTSYHKKLFGRSLVVEAGLLGFQKWLVVTEQTMSSEEYLNFFDNTKLQPDGSRVTSATSSSYKVKDTPLPPTPLPPLPPKQAEGLLPNIYFDEKDHKLEGVEHQENEHSDYRKYLNSLEDLNEDSFTADVQVRSKNSKSSAGRRKPPSAKDQEYLNIATQTAAMSNLQVSSPQEIVNGTNSRTPRPVSNQSEYATARESYHAQRDDSFSPQRGFEEPYENYETPYEPRETKAPGSEPFENYVIPGAEHADHYNQYEQYQQLPHHSNYEQQQPHHTHYEQEPIDQAQPGIQFEQPQYEQSQQEIQHEPEAQYIQPDAQPILPYQPNETDISLSPENIQEPQFATSEESEEARRKKEERRQRRKEKRRKEKEKEKANAAMFFPFGMFPPGPPPGMENMPPPTMDNMPPGFFPIPPLMEPVSPKKKEKRKKKKKDEAKEAVNVILESGDVNVPSIAFTSASIESSPAQAVVEKEVQQVHAPREQQVQQTPPLPNKDHQEVYVTQPSEYSTPTQLPRERRSPHRSEQSSPRHVDVRTHEQAPKAVPKPAMSQKKSLPEVPQLTPQVNGDTRPNSQTPEQSLTTLWSLSPNTRRNPEVPSKAGMYAGQPPPSAPIGMATSPKFGISPGHESPGIEPAPSALNSHHATGHKSANNLPVYQSQPTSTLGHQSAPHLPHPTHAKSATPSPRINAAPRNPLNGQPRVQPQQPPQPQYGQAQQQLPRHNQPAGPLGSASNAGAAPHPASHSAPHLGAPGHQAPRPGAPTHGYSGAPPPPHTGAPPPPHTGAPPAPHPSYPGYSHPPAGYPPPGQPYYPPPGQPYYPPPGQSYYPPAQPYYPAPGQPYYPQPYYPPPTGHHPPPPAAQAAPKQTSSDVAMMSLPTGSRFNKNKANKADLRATFNNNTFGI